VRAFADWFVAGQEEEEYAAGVTASSVEWSNPSWRSCASGPLPACPLSPIYPLQFVLGSRRKK
jgi:hypothetical protein